MLNSLTKGLLDIFYPRICLVCKTKLTGCSSVDNLVCLKCWLKIERNRPPFCYSCGRQLEISELSKNICPVCIKRKFYFDRAFSPCIYTGVIKELIHLFKYNHKDHLGSSLGRLMIEFAKEYNLPMEYIDFIIPVPLHKTRLREREFNQAQILSSQISKEFNKDMRGDILLRSRQTKTQIELETDERLLNVKGCFSVTRERDLKGKNILLVDDVLTTGATSSEAACTLKQSGADIVFVLTLAN